jgi:F-type H+-transporting ATPase subunit delta
MKGELEAVAAQYAEAALELAEKADGANSFATSERVLADLIGINEVIEKNPDLATVLNHPAVEAPKKLELMLKVFEGKLSDITERLLRLVSDRGRLDILKSLEEKFAQFLRERKNIVGAKLTSSKELTASEIADIKARLTEHLGKKLELEVIIDKSLLGGVILRLGDQVIDGSLKGKLAVVEKELLAV